MSNPHEILLNGAKRAIDRLFSDMSVPRETTLEDLVELRDDLDIRIEGIRCDMGRDDG